MDGAFAEWTLSAAGKSGIGFFYEEDQFDSLMVGVETPSILTLLSCQSLFLNTNFLIHETIKNLPAILQYLFNTGKFPNIERSKQFE